MTERRDRPLEVKPVRRYRVPRYPSHLDPDPTRHPRAIPYPFTSNVARVAASLGITASIFGAACADESAGKTAEARRPHPLTLGQSGLPFRTSSYGTGEPELLDEMHAREVIDRLFAEAGYSLRPAWQYDHADVSFTADGYDPTRKVGYVFATWKNLEGDAWDNWWGGDPRGAEQEVASLEGVLSEEVGARVRQARAVADPKARDAAFVAIRDESVRTRLSLRDGRALEREAERGETFIAIIAQTDRRFCYQPDYSREAMERRREAEAITDPAERQRAVAAIEKADAKEVLAALEQAVREYLAWVKSQGG